MTGSSISLGQPSGYKYVYKKDWSDPDLFNSISIIMKSAALDKYPWILW